MIKARQQGYMATFIPGIKVYWYIIPVYGYIGSSANLFLPLGGHKIFCLQQNTHHSRAKCLAVLMVSFVMELDLNSLGNCIASSLRCSGMTPTLAHILYHHHHVAQTQCCESQTNDCLRCICEQAQHVLSQLTMPFTQTP